MSSHPKAMSWDPKSPHALLLPRIEQGKPAAVDTFLSHAGTGCNSHELAALMKILQAHEQYYNTNAVDVESSFNNYNRLSLKQLSQAYRSALCDCLAGWEMEEANDETGINNDSGDSGGGDLSMSIDILRAMYSVMHLSDIFLPLGLPSTLHLDFLQDPFEQPGVATADTVRYLRYNQVSDSEAMDPQNIAEMLNSMQPEEFAGGDLYWKYLKSLVLHGCLEKAWSVLSRHSLFTTAMSTAPSIDDDANAYYAAITDEARQGFQDLMEIFLRAPLPGGRTSDYDDVMGTPDWEDEEESQIDSYHLEGLDVAGQDYKFWESGDAASTNATGAANVNASGDYPMIYSSDAAIRKHRQWREYVSDRRMSFALSRRIPEIDSILAILTGNLTGIVFESWAERLLAELLYRQPDLRPRHLAARTRKIIKDCTGEDASTNGVHVAIVSIMDGNAGQAIEAMYLLGGGSGAALPSTLVRAMCVRYLVHCAIRHGTHQLTIPYCIFPLVTR
jgi:hypothetical protein